MFDGLLSYGEILQATVAAAAEIVIGLAFIVGVIKFAPSVFNNFSDRVKANQTAGEIWRYVATALLIVLGALVIVGSLIWLIHEWGNVSEVVGVFWDEFTQTAGG